MSFGGDTIICGLCSRLFLDGYLMVQSGVIMESMSRVFSHGIFFVIYRRSCFLTSW